MPKAYIKPSEAKAWKECARRVWLDNKADITLEPSEDAFEQMVIDLGLAHEQAVLDRLSEELDVHTANSPEHTRKLMNDGVDAIYQAQLVDETNDFIGYPDFLIRQDDGQYQPADAKLSLSEEKKEIQIQLGFYRQMLGTELPAKVFLGDGTEALIADEANTITNEFITSIRELLASDEEPLVHYRHSKCKACSYYTHCKPAFKEKEALSLLYGIQGRSVMGLEEQGIDTISKLAATSPENIEDVPYLKGFDKKQKAA